MRMGYYFRKTSTSYVFKPCDICRVIICNDSDNDKSTGLHSTDYFLGLGKLVYSTQLLGEVVSTWYAV